MIPFLELLGFYDIEVQRSSAEDGGETYFISHRAGADPDAPPVHIVALDQALDRRDSARRSPHALVQDYLNRADALWGIATNGRRLRLLRDSARLSKPTYLEFDLEGMIESNLYSEFVLLYRLLHSTRFPRDAAGAHDCLLERYYHQGIDEGGRVRDKLRDGVEEALKILGTAFLEHPESTDLRDGFDRSLIDAPGYYRQLLRLVYRFLFLMVAEERRLVFPPDADADLHAIYTKYYSVGRLRDRAERYFTGDGNSDLWLGLRETFRLLRDNDAAQKLGLAALNGELFGAEACSDLEGTACTNEALLTAMRHLSTFVDDAGTGRPRRRSAGIRRRVNYAALDVEEFGSVYESLLDFHPQVTPEPPRFDLVTGSERKQTGSYYTPPELVRELIDSALVPVMEERLAAVKTRDEKERALLDLRVCDPAAGSGHFLLAAARRIARELAKVRGGEDEPSPWEYRHALRDVIRQSIYAVDKNPLAVDLCKVALWMEGHNAGLPLSFLDHHVKCGDSLVGVFDLKVLDQGIPDEAYKPLTGDDKIAAKYYRECNKKERSGQLGLAAGPQHPEIPDEVAAELRALSMRDEREPNDVHAKEALYEKIRARGSEWWRLKVACDLWTYAFFAPMPPMNGVPSPEIPTTDAIRKHLGTNSAFPALVGVAVGYSQRHSFFHWPLEFSDVFEGGRFDIVVGNPPWERVEMQEQEFFAPRNPAIANARNAARRKEMIESLDETDPILAEQYRVAKRQPQAEVAFFKEGGRYPYGAEGKINTYAIFADLFRQLTGEDGAAALLLPNGLVTGFTYRDFLRHLLETRTLASFYGFENEDKIFSDVHNETKFGILTMTGALRPVEEPWFTAHIRQPDQIRDPARRYSLSAKQSTQRS